MELWGSTLAVGQLFYNPKVACARGPGMGPLGVWVMGIETASSCESMCVTGPCLGCQWLWPPCVW